MASSIIHLAVAKEVNKVLKRDNSRLYIGSIAPDISKNIGENKIKSHFLDGPNTDVPNLDKFFDKYKKYLYDDFVMGYYIHLITDYLWYKYFMTEFYDSHMITKLDGTEVKCVDRMLTLYIYNDYTDLNMKIIDEYGLDLKIFYQDIPDIPNIISEIPMDRLDIIVNKASVIIENSKENKSMVFNIDNVKKFISFSTEIIINNINEIMEG